MERALTSTLLIALKLCVLSIMAGERRQSTARLLAGTALARAEDARRLPRHPEMPEIARTDRVNLTHADA